MTEIIYRIFIYQKTHARTKPIEEIVCQTGVTVCSPVIHSFHYRKTKQFVYISGLLSKGEIKSNILKIEIKSSALFYKMRYRMS